MMQDETDLSTGYMARSNSAAVSDAEKRLADFLAEGAKRRGEVPAPAAPAAKTPAPSGPAPRRGVIADVAIGTITSPVQAGGGVLDAVGNVASGLGGLGDWFDANVVDLSVDLPSSGNKTIDTIVSALGRPLDTIGRVGELVPDSGTVTGGMVREGAKFLTGFLPALRAMRAAGVANKTAAVVGAGAVAGATVVDPEAPNIANLIEENVWVPPGLSQIVDRLATDPEDSQLVNRAKNAITDAGFGAAAEGVFKGVMAVARARRAATGAKPAPQTPEEAMRAEYGEVTAEQLAPLGNDTAPVFTVSKATADKIARGAKETEGLTAIPTADGESDFFINFARISEPDDVKGVMQKMANAYRGSIDEARRGVQTHDMTRALAADLGMGVDDLLQRRAGAAMNAEEVTAARELLGASARKLVELSERAASPNAGDVDRYMFRRMLATHHAVQAEVFAVRAEGARALNAWKIPVSGVERSRAIKLILDQHGGAGVASDLAKRIASLKGADVSPAALNATVRKGWAATTKDMVREAYVLGLLWGPQTHLVNVMSNSIVATQQIYERAVAAQIGRLTGRQGVQTGEATAMMYGLSASLRDAFTVAGRAIRTGEAGAALGKTEVREQAISSATIARERGLTMAEAQAFKETGLGRAVDFIGFANGIPGRLLSGQDEFFKTIGYRMEVHAQAVRMARSSGKQGKDYIDEVARLTNDPPENVRIAAADAALYNTFQNEPGNLVKSLMQAREGGSLNPMFLLLPFLKTPGNLLSYTFERSPAALLVTRWRADVAAGGARRDLALSRVATGTAVMMTATDLAASGLLTGAGPSKPEDRDALVRMGWQRNSVRIGDKFYSYSRTDPLGMLLGFAASANERMNDAELSDDEIDEFQEWMGAGAAVVAETVVDKTFFQSFNNLVFAIQTADQGTGPLERVVNQQLGTLVPFTSALATMERFADPLQREARSPYEVIESRFPGFSQRLPPRRDLWGRALQPDQVYGRAYDVISPVWVTQLKDSPIDAEMVRIGAGRGRIPVKDTFDGAAVNFRDYPDVYDAYTRLAGNELEHPAWGVGAKDLLDDVVSGTHALSTIYDMQSDIGKAEFIKNMITEYRGLAQREIVDSGDYPEFTDYVRQRKAETARARLPTFMQEALP